MSALGVTPADEGIAAVALDDARARGLGDDGCFDAVASALRVEAGLSAEDARSLAYSTVHGSRS